MAHLSIGKVAGATGLGIDTIRFYEKEGLLPPPARTAAGYRIYTADSVARLHFVRRAKALGFTLAEVRNLLRLSDGEGDQAAIKALTEEKIAAIDQKLVDLQRIRDALANLADDCPGHRGERDCPIIQALSGDEAEAPR